MRNVSLVMAMSIGLFVTTTGNFSVSGMKMIKVLERLQKEVDKEELNIIRNVIRKR
jgi:hypothetical protein